MAAPSTLRGITLDFWSTLFFDPPGGEVPRSRLRIAALDRTLRALGWPFAPADVEAAHTAVGEEHRQMHAEGRDITLPAQVALLLEHLQPGISSRLGAEALATVIAAYTSPALAAPPRPALPNLPELLAALRGRGLRVGLISNTGRTPGAILRGTLEQAGILAYFDHLTFSDEAEAAKPGVAIFQQTLRALGVEAAAAVHVGDDPVLDVLGAHRAGLRAIQVGPAPLAADAGEAPDVWIPSLDELPRALDRLESAQARP